MTNQRKKRGIDGYQIKRGGWSRSHGVCGGSLLDSSPHEGEPVHGTYEMETFYTGVD